MKAPLHFQDTTDRLVVRSPYTLARGLHCEMPGQQKTNYEIRPGLARDAEDVRLLAKDLTTAFPFNHHAFRRSYSSVLENPSATLLVAGRETRVIGYLLGYGHSTSWAGANVSWVEELFVNGPQRGHGIGRALMSAVESQARNAGGRLVCLITRRATESYRAIGYEELAVYLRKTL